MTSIIQSKRPGATPSEPAILPLENGDHLDQKTFHARYEAMPKNFRAELIGGIVYVSSPLKRPHGRTHVQVVQWLKEYEDATPGVETYDNATNILGADSEPQPDACLLIGSDKGQTREEDEYIVGAPELIAEVGASTASIDLHSKRKDYECAGVKEYIVVVLEPLRVYWFVSREGQFVEMTPEADGILRSQIFPGLWLDPAALARQDLVTLRAVWQKGLATPEHAAFVEWFAKP